MKGPPGTSPSASPGQTQVLLSTEGGRCSRRLLQLSGSAGSARTRLHTHLLLQPPEPQTSPVDSEGPCSPSGCHLALPNGAPLAPVRTKAWVKSQSTSWLGIPFPSGCEVSRRGNVLLPYRAPVSPPASPEEPPLSAESRRRPAAVSLVESEEPGSREGELVEYCEH